MSTGEKTSLSSEQVDAMSDLLHQITWGIRLDQLGTWSKALRGMAQLDLHILKLIAERPDIILKEICYELHIPSSTLTSAINRLEERELLNRVISRRDRRSYGLELTTKGWEIKQEHDRVDRMIASKVIGALEDNEEVTTLVNLLSKVVQHFE